MTIAEERRALTAKLAAALEATTDEIEHAIAAEQRHASGRHLVGTLAAVAWLEALLHSLSVGERRSWLAAIGYRGVPRRDRIVSGAFLDVAAELAEELAGHFDVYYDGNWPDALTPARLSGRIPDSAGPGDTIIGGDGEGGRMELHVLREPEGKLTAAPDPDSWREPPFDTVWLATYTRLAEAYPEEIPPDLRAP